LQRERISHLIIIKSIEVIIPQLKIYKGCFSLKDFSRLHLYMTSRDKRKMMSRFLIVISLLSTTLSACSPVSQAIPTHAFENNLSPTDQNPSPDQQRNSTISASPPHPDDHLQNGIMTFRCPDADEMWITDLEIIETPIISEPAPREAYIDPSFGTCIIRVTDRNRDLSLDDPSKGLKNEYSRVQSFNADGSMFLLYGTEGTWYIYDVSTLQPIHQISIGVEPRWDSTDPNLLYFIDETRLMTYLVSEAEQWILHDFSQDFPSQQLSAVWTRFEGSPSLDSRYWGLMVEDEDWLTTAYLIYDLQEDRIIALHELQTPIEVDSVTISPLGNYFLAYLDEYCHEDRLGSDTSPCGLMVYDREFEEGYGLLRIVGHSDLVLDAEGNEVLVYQDIDTDYVSMLDLASGLITPLWPIDFTHSPIGLHFSGRGFNMRGWVLVSTYSGAQPAATWMDDQIFALELKPKGRVVRFAHSHSIVDEHQEHDYWAEPHASVNPDFTQILFTSNWGRSGTGEVDTYLIRLPQDWESNLP
jgi:hypothetical protein